MELNRKKLLIVDDEKSNVQSLKHVFTRENFTVDTAYNGQEALEILRQKDYHVVLSDMKMPHLDGFDLLRVIKRIKPQIEVVMMSAYGTIELARPVTIATPLCYERTVSSESLNTVRATVHHVHVTLRANRNPLWVYKLVVAGPLVTPRRDENTISSELLNAMIAFVYHVNVTG